MTHVLLTGATGFLGRHAAPVLRARFGERNVVAISSRNCDLLDAGATRTMFAEIRPEIVVHLAAYSGGIGANRRYPADFYYRNTLLTAHVFDAAARSGVKKLIYTMGGCSYPSNARSPIDEGQLWAGYPQDESAGYSTAKMMGTVASRSYRSQYGLDSVVLIPGNMYGEYDNFRAEESHVVPAMVRRYYEAQRNGVGTVTMWGSGAPERDFVYAGDVARCLPYFIDNYSSTEPVNLSSGVPTSIRELAATIAELVGFEGRVEWDTTQPDGQMVKIFDVTRMHGLGLRCDTPLRQGLKRTIDWFSATYEGARDGLRL